MRACPPAVPDYALAHDLVNELMIVIAECDLFAEELLECKAPNRLHAIREIAVHMSQRIALQQVDGGRQVH